MVPWLKVRCDIHEDMAVVAASLGLGVSENEVVGALIRFWAWANLQTRDGDARSVTCAWLDRHVRLPGFAEAMRRGGWLECYGDGLRVPKFDRHNGASAKARAQNAVRNETYRDCRKNGGADESRDARRHRDARTVTPPSRNASPEEEEDIEEEKNPPYPPGGDRKPPLRRQRTPPEATPEFARFWDAYPRKEARQAALKAFARLAPTPELLDAMLAAVERQKLRGCLEPRCGADGRSVIPHATTWLNQRRWEDEPPPTGTAPPKPAAPSFDDLLGDLGGRP